MKLSDSSSAVIREAIRHAETKQTAQLQIALAADTRAMALAVACAGISGVLISIAATSSDDASRIVISMMAVTFFLAAGFAAWSARPIDFAAPGQDFSDFEDDIDAGRPLDDVFQELGAHLDQCAAENQRRIDMNAQCFRAALILSALAPLVGGLTAVLNIE